MAIKALSLNPIDYISKLDDPENPTVWKIRGLTRLEWLEVENSMQSSEIAMDGDDVKTIASKQNNGTVGKLILDYGLVGWQNFTEDGKTDIPFTNLNKEKIPREVREELVVHISNLTSIKSADAGN